MKDRFIEDEIKSTIKKLLIMEIIDNGIQPMPRNMITKTKLFESNLQMGREIYFMKELILGFNLWLLFNICVDYILYSYV